MTTASAGAQRPGAQRAGTRTDATNPTCERCGAEFKRSTSERICPDCLAPLAALRERAGLTAAELARRVGCRPKAIADLERNLHHPRLDRARKIANALGVEVFVAFPELAVTKGEAARELRLTSRDLLRLCETGVLPSDTSGHWHRIPLRPVLELAREREDLRRNWVSLNAAEAKYGLPRWVLRRLILEGRLNE
jgi:transcriptional regulator with XRE-family HTH domain